MNQKNIKDGCEKTKEIFKFIQEFIKENKYAPTVREIGDGVGLKSTSSVYAHIKILIAQGYLVENDYRGEPRKLKVAAGYRPKELKDFKDIPELICDRYCKFRDVAKDTDDMLENYCGECMLADFFEAVQEA